MLRGLGTMTKGARNAALTNIFVVSLASLCLAAPTSARTEFCSALLLQQSARHLYSEVWYLTRDVTANSDRLCARENHRAKATCSPWAAVPLIAVFDPAITTSTTRGPCRLRLRHSLSDTLLDKLTAAKSSLIGVCRRQSCRSSPLLPTSGHLLLLRYVDVIGRKTPSAPVGHCEISFFNMSGE